MCSTDLGVLDLLFDKEDLTCKSLDGFRNTLFSSADILDPPDVNVKEEVLDSGTIDWKMSNDWDADELLRSVLDGQDMTCPTLNTPTLEPLPTLPSMHHTLESHDDMDSLEDMVGLPFHAVMDSGASDSGMSSDSSLDQQMSPGSGYSVSSPESMLGLASPDRGQDTISEVSSTTSSELGSNSPQGSFINAFPGSPETLLAADDFLLPDSGFSSPVRQVVCEPINVVTPASVPVPAPTSVPAPVSVPVPAPAPVPVTRTVVTKVGTTAGVTPVTLPTSVNLSSVTGNSTPLLKTVTVGGSNNVLGGQTIVVTQGNKVGNNAQVLRGPTILKSGQTSRSILLPVTVKDLNQVRTIKIISTGGNSGLGGRGVRTVVSTVRTPTTATTTFNNQSIRTALLGTVRGQESKSLLKGGASTILTTCRPSTTATATTTTTTTSHTTSPTRVKLEPLDDDDDDDDDYDQQPHTAFQQLTLSDEEKRLLKKEGILLPSHYPLTKQEERELKRIRRKIRNKISAQDSRKRKKEYIDGLEDRVKACTEENQQLQKRIRNLEAQNETMLVQMRRFQSAVTGGSSGGRLQTHASTALMMLILSAALFIVPAVRQDTPSSDSDLSLPVTKMPSPGHSRSLLEAGNVGGVVENLAVLESVDDEIGMEVEVPLVEALNDHDYTPATKRQRTSHNTSPYLVPPLDDFPPQHGKQDSGGGFPPDDGTVAKISARIMDSMVDQITNNYSDPGGKPNNVQAVVVNLGQGRKRLRDDLELE